MIDFPSYVVLSCVFRCSSRSLSVASILPHRRLYCHGDRRAKKNVENDEPQPRQNIQNTLRVERSNDNQTLAYNMQGRSSEDGASFVSMLLTTCFGDEAMMWPLLLLFFQTFVS